MTSTTPPLRLALPRQRDGRVVEDWDLTLPCRQHDGELWFSQEPVDVELAKRLCADCPVRAGCLSGALEREEPWGVWGGELLLHGRVVPRKRPRGRPRKDTTGAPARHDGTPEHATASGPCGGDVDAA